MTDNICSVGCESFLYSMHNYVPQATHFRQFLFICYAQALAEMELRAGGEEGLAYLLDGGVCVCVCVCMRCLLRCHAPLTLFPATDAGAKGSLAPF